MSGKPFVFVLGCDGKPLMPCTGKRARLLLERKRAIVKRVKPFVIQLIDRSQSNSELQNLEVKIDPGSKTTGLCISRTVDRIVNVISLYEIEHRGNSIKLGLQQRAMYRRARRNRNTRYRPMRFLNRTKPKGWLPPSLMHRVISIISWVKRFMRWSPITGISLERVKFDTQKLQNSEISGIEYQQGTLFNYDVREYLLEKWNRQCTYCNVKNVALEIEHIIPKSKGGSNRISNLCLACKPCNQKKAALSIQDFLWDKPELLVKILKQIKTPLKDTTAINATRNKLFIELLNLGLPIETGTGAQTKFNRLQFGIPKTHALDAACIGDILGISVKNVFHNGIISISRGKYKRTLPNKYGFPKAYLMKTKRIYGFATGDLVKVYIKLSRNNYKKIIGKIAIRLSGQFNIKDKHNNIFRLMYNKCKLLQKSDGYSYFNKLYNFIKIKNKLLTIGEL